MKIRLTLNKIQSAIISLILGMVLVLPEWHIIKANSSLFLSLGILWGVCIVVVYVFGDKGNPN